MITRVVSPTTPTADSLVTIGRILKPFGVRGEVKVESLSDVPGRFEELEKMYLTLPHSGATPKESTVTQVRKVPSGYLMKCSLFSTPEEAAHFNGAWIQIPESRELPRGPDTFYHFEVIGLCVVDPDGQRLGTVVEILEYPQHPVLVVRNQETEYLIPANRRTIEKVDLENQSLHVASRETWDISHAV